MKKVNNLELSWLVHSVLSAENCDESDNANIIVESGNLDFRGNKSFIWYSKVLMKL